MSEVLEFLSNINWQKWSAFIMIAIALCKVIKKAIEFFQQKRHKRTEQKVFVKCLKKINSNIAENPRRYDEKIPLKKQYKNTVTIKNLERIKPSNLPLWLEEEEKEQLELTYQLSNEHNKFREQTIIKNPALNLDGKHPKEIYDTRMDKLFSLNDELLKIIKKYEEKK